MSDPPLDRCRLLRSAPYFPVADVESTVAHYRDVLGFEAEYVAGSPAEFAICSRDGLAIFMRRAPEAGRITPSEAQGGSWDAFFWVDDARALHSELVAKGAVVVYGPVLQTYGILELAVRDPDGHVLGFGEARQ